MALASNPHQYHHRFLGAGKTTAIVHWLKHKPADEYWAVLVNEFGEVGIDGALLKGQGAMIKEIPGGCMCCVAGLPMQVGLHRLIAEAKPQRILIEPTGLGHPAQIIEALTSPPFDKLLTLQASLCLIDPRKVQDARYLEHETFQAQAALADVLVASKVDVASDADLAAFEAFADGFPALKYRAYSRRGDLDLAWLSKPYGNKQLPKSAAHSSPTNPSPIAFYSCQAPLRGSCLSAGRTRVRVLCLWLGVSARGGICHGAFIYLVVGAGVSAAEGGDDHRGGDHRL